MVDREKVIKGLCDLRRYIEDKEWSDNRAERQTAKVHWQTMTDAITLLKEQKPVKPKTDNLRRFLCGSCEAIIGQGQNYCGKCGKQVDWKK